MESESPLETILHELNAYLDRPPPRGSIAARRFIELMREVERRKAVAAPGPYADRLESLGERIQAFERRLDVERHAHDVAPGEPAMPPLLGGDIRPH